VPLRSPPPPVPAPPGDKGEPPPSPEPKKPTKAKAHLDKLLAFAKAAKASGHDDGQAYADELAESGLAAVQGAIGSTIAAIEEELDAATSYEDLQQRLRARYEDLDPSEITDVIESCMVLAELAGRHAVNLDN
jgi:phage gp29-like protein